MKHSPAPWYVDPDPRPDMEWNNHIYGADGLAVCFMAHRDGKDDERDEANASLIASAPELLRAAEELRAAQRAYMADRGNDDKGKLVALAAGKLDAAILKAKAA